MRCLIHEGLACQLYIKNKEERKENTHEIESVGKLFIRKKLKEKSLNLADGNLTILNISP